VRGAARGEDFRLGGAGAGLELGKLRLFGVDATRPSHEGEAFGGGDRSSGAFAERAEKNGSLSGVVDRSSTSSNDRLIPGRGGCGGSRSSFSCHETNVIAKFRICHANLFKSKEESCMNEFSGFLGLFCIVLSLLVAGLSWRVRQLSARLDDSQFQNRSLSTTYGRITEQWFPLMNEYPYDPQGFRFLGSPLDGVQFEEDRIVFVEFKTNRSRLSEKQKRLKDLIERGEVYFEEFRFTEDA
jgi:hypothetical protein